MINLNSSQNSHRIAALDGLRGLAILLVMFYHFTILTPDHPLERYFVSLSMLGMHGVDLFFVLSGFLISAILIESKDKSNYFRNFYMRRVLRIFPLYYLCIIFSFLILPNLFSLNTDFQIKQERFASVHRDWLWYVLYASNFLIAKNEAFRHGVLDVSWSLSIEEQFYVIWPIVVYVFNQKQLLRICLVIIVSALLVRIVVWSLGYSWIQIYVLTITRMDSIAFGAILATLVKSSMVDRYWLVKLAKRVIFIGSVLFPVLWLLGWFNHQSAFMLTIGYSLLNMFFASLLTLALLKSFQTKIWCNRFLIFFGKHSYALYLFHLPIRAVLRDLIFHPYFVDAMPSFLWQPLFYLLATLAVTIPAVLSWYLIEKPMLSLKYKFAS